VISFFSNAAELASATPTLTPTLDPQTETPIANLLTDTPNVTPTSDLPTDTPNASPTSNLPSDTPGITPTSGLPTDTPGTNPTSNLPTDTPGVTPTSNLLTNTPGVTPTLNQITDTPAVTETTNPATATPTPTATSGGGGASTSGQVPVFSHVIVMIFENEEITNIIGNSSLSNFNGLAQQYALLTNDYAVAHPSLPNYIALTSGDTQGITSDCTNCFINATNLPDLVESSGRTWKDYMEDMPAACTLGDFGDYAQKHNPFIYYDDIRTDAIRCQQHDVPLTQLDIDLQNRALPSFAWITPNLCNDGHNCGAAVADKFLGMEVNKIISFPAFDQNSLLVVTFDEGTSNQSCCGLPGQAGGKVATILISGLVKPGFQDTTAYSHYSILKTIENSWGLSELGHSNDAQTNLISDVWK
jgi:hypothetical protein